MKIYLINCGKSVKKQMRQIISDRNLGAVADMPDAFSGMLSQEAKEVIVIAELTKKSLPNLQKARETWPLAAFIILPEANDTETIKAAYELGAEFVLHYPLNEIELWHILKNIEMAGIMNWMIHKLEIDFFKFPTAASLENGLKPCDSSSANYIRRIKDTLQKIGVFCEAGSRDIIRIAEYLKEQDIALEDITLNELCVKMGEKTKNVEQRIRRAAFTGLTNLASRGLNDYSDPIFNEFAGKLYPFEQIKKEMDYINGKSERHGNVRIRKFLLVLLECCKEP